MPPRNRNARRDRGATAHRQEPMQTSSVPPEFYMTEECARLAAMVPGVSNGPQLVSDVQRLMSACVEVTRGHLGTPSVRTLYGYPTLAKINAVSDIIDEFGDDMAVVSQGPNDPNPTLMRYTMMWTQDEFRRTLLDLMTLSVRLAADPALPRAERSAYRRMLAVVASSLLTFANCIAQPSTPPPIKRAYRSTVTVLARSQLLNAVSRLMAAELAEGKLKVRRDKGLPAERTHEVPALPAQTAAGHSAPKLPERKGQRKGGNRSANTLSASQKQEASAAAAAAAEEAAADEQAAITAVGTVSVDSLVLGLGLAATVLQSLTAMDPQSHPGPRAILVVGSDDSGGDGSGGDVSGGGGSTRDAAVSITAVGTAARRRRGAASGASGSSLPEHTDPHAGGVDPRAEFLSALAKSHVLEHSAQRLLFMAAADGGDRLRAAASAFSADGSAAAAAPPSAAQATASPGAGSSSSSGGATAATTGGGAGTGARRKHEPLREGEAFEAAFKSLLLVLQDTVGSSCTAGGTHAAELASLVSSPCLQHLLVLRLVHALNAIDGGGATGLPARYADGLPPVGYRVLDPVDGTSGGDDSGGARNVLIDLQATTLPLDAWNLILYRPDADRAALEAGLQPYSPAAVHALCIRTVRAMLLSARLWQPDLAKVFSRKARWPPPTAATAETAATPATEGSGGGAAGGGAAVMAEGLTAVTAIAAVLVADKASRLLPAAAQARARDVWWAAAVDSLHLAFSHGVASVESLPEKAVQLLIAVLQRPGMSARLPSTLPSEAPPEVGAALRAGILPCLERALRRELSGGPPPVRMRPNAPLRVPPPATPPTASELASIAKPALAWPQLGWLMAYGDPHEAAALIATVGKLILRMCDAAAAAWATDPRVDPAAAAAGTNWRSVAALLQPMYDASRFSLLWMTTSADGAADGAGPGRQLRRLATFMVLQWMPVWCRLMRHCCAALRKPHSAAAAAVASPAATTTGGGSAAAATSPAADAGIEAIRRSLKHVSGLAVELVLPYLGSGLRWSFPESPPNPGGWAGEEWRQLLRERCGIDAVGTLAHVLAAIEAGHLTEGFGRDTLVGLLTHTAVSMPAEMRAALVVGCGGPGPGGGVGPLLPIVQRLFGGAAAAAASSSSAAVARRPAVFPNGIPLSEDCTTDEASVNTAATAMLALMRSVVEGADLSTWRLAVAATAPVAAAGGGGALPRPPSSALTRASGSRVTGGGGGGEGTAAEPEADTLTLVPAEARPLLRVCANPGCLNLAGDSETELERGLLRCTGCGGAWYCDRACQRAHWEGGHKEACKWRRDSAKAK